ncbi:pyocin knob domain-containing protein [Fodinisporobacter ferrooxydans]|uniref:Pyocin knob domain-containing protein n=1 Tax=Fodinisporobacter ferrooxydans TaxID=2901836 RepID=A0ABY4CNI3_9BACL|nr:pyocin knob domain-containing protein [Alicyclobacillaceae bacterium MYW30-H2]
MALYDVTNLTSGNQTDLNQIIDALSGNNDVGVIQAFAQISPPGALSAAINTSSGNLTGSYQYKVALLTGYWQGPAGTGTIHTQGNTSGGTTSNTVSPSAQQVNLTSIPVGGIGVVARVIYRTKANGSTYYQLVQINDNTTTSWTDTIADSALVTVMPTINTTGSYFSGDGSGLNPATISKAGVVKGSSSVLVAPDGTLSTNLYSVDSLFVQDLFGNTSVVLSGGVATKDGTVANQLDVTAADVYFSGGQHVNFAASQNGQFVTSVANTTYYLDYNSDGTTSWGTAHSTKAGYVPICQVTTDASGNISTVTDKRPTTVNLLTGAIGNVKFQNNVQASKFIGDGSQLTGITASQVGAIPTTAEAAANGVATLDATGNVPASQLGNVPVVPLASTTTPGKVQVSTAPVSGQNPVAVATTDPVYQNAARKDQANTFTANQTVNAILNATTLQQNGHVVWDNNNLPNPAQTNGSTFSDLVIGALMTSRLADQLQIGKNNTALSSASYAQGNIEVVTNDGSSPIIGFHREGYYAKAMYLHQDGSMRTMGSDGIDAKLWDSSNDGAGSGLDADLFRGLDAVTFNTDGGATGIAGTDLNTLTTTGFYNGNNLTNAPNGDTIDWFYIEVIRHVNTDGFCLQRATTLNASVDNVYYRLQKGGTWGAWKLMTSNLQTQPVASFSTTSTTYVTALSVTGKGRLLGLAGDAYTASEIIIDGVTVATSKYTDAALNTLAFSSNSSGWSPAGMFWDFTSSLQINIYTSNSSYATTIFYAYAKEV